MIIRKESGQSPVAGSQIPEALLQRIEDSIAVTRWDDLATPGEIARPTETVALRLEQRAAGAAFAREAELKAHFEAEMQDGDGSVRPHRGNIKMGDADADWLSASEDLLFVRKRAETLAQLLFAKRVFREARLRRWPVQALQRLFKSRDGRVR